MAGGCQLMLQPGMPSNWADVEVGGADVCQAAWMTLMCSTSRGQQAPWAGQQPCCACRGPHWPTSDAQGTAIEITMWKEATDKWFGGLEQGKVSARDCKGTAHTFSFACTSEEDLHEGQQAPLKTFTPSTRRWPQAECTLYEASDCGHHT